jgi:hypothetical protein
LIDDTGRIRFFDTDLSKLSFQPLTGRTVEYRL